MKKIIIALFVSALVFAACGMGSGNQQKEKTKTEKTMKTIKLDKALFLAKVADFEKDPKGWKYLGDKPAIIDFYADWCGPCRSIAPILEELAEEYDGKIIIYKLDVDKEQELAGMFGVRSIPTLLFIPMTGQPQMAQGAMPKSEFEELINSVLLPKK